MDLLADLTDPQREAVTHTTGPLLVLAGAGSGKTRVITRRVAWLLAQGIPSDRILALTFTNKAAGEMRARIEDLAPRRAVWVGTFHGFCARMLRRYSPLVGIDTSFSIYDQADRLRVVKSVMEVLGWEEDGWTPERVEAAISRAKNELVNPAAMSHRARDHHGRKVAQVYELYEARLKMTSAVDFDDLLVHMVAILKEHRDVRVELDRRFKYVLVDEYQDTNLAQYAIVLAHVGRASEPVRDRRPGPVDLWMARSQSVEHPRISSTNSRAAAWSRSSGTTAAPRTSSASPTT